MVVVRPLPGHHAGRVLALCNFIVLLLENTLSSAPRVYVRPVLLAYRISVWSSESIWIGQAGRQCTEEDFVCVSQLASQCRQLLGNCAGTIEYRNRAIYSCGRGVEFRYPDYLYPALRQLLSS